MKRAELDALAARVDAIERDRAREKHVHEWRYGKTVEGSESGFTSRWIMWWWECTGADVCGTGKSSTNTLSHVPDHFPRDVR